MPPERGQDESEEESGGAREGANKGATGLPCS